MKKLFIILVAVLSITSCRKYQSTDNTITGPVMIQVHAIHENNLTVTSEVILVR